AEVGDGVGGEVGDEPDEGLPVAGVDALEAAPAEPPSGGHEVAAGDLVDVGAVLEHLGDAGPELTAHAGHQNAHQPLPPPRPVSSPSGRRWGNKMTSRMLETPAMSMTSRSTPTPRPPHGGSPYSRARR